jgi:hypothetical protein
MLPFENQFGIAPRRRGETAKRAEARKYTIYGSAKGRMADFIYVDNSNLYIEGKRVSAVKKGLAMNIYDAMNNRILDFGYNISFGRLHEFVAGKDKSQIARAVLFGSRPPPEDSIWRYAEKAGFELVLEDRNVANKEKKIDTGIVSAMVRDAYKKSECGD